MPASLDRLGEFERLVLQMLTHVLNSLDDEYADSFENLMTIHNIEDEDRLDEEYNRVQSKAVKRLAAALICWATGASDKLVDLAVAHSTQHDGDPTPSLRRVPGS